jgi:hypothetical protein
MMSLTVERIANLACLLEEPLQEKLWEYAELLYVEQVAFDSTDPMTHRDLQEALHTALYGDTGRPLSP